MTKITKKNCYQLLVYCMILLFASCENPVIPEIVEIVVPEVIEKPVTDPIEDPVIVIPEIELTIYSLQGVQRTETKSPIETLRYIIDTTEYINMMIELDGKDSFLFMNNNMLSFFGIDIQSMSLEEYNIVIEVVGLFPGMRIKELQNIY